MIHLSLTNIGKRYNYEWIFRKVNLEFTNENNYVILGANGSGKSTLLQVIGGSLIPSEGELTCHINSEKIEQENLYKYMSYAAPYIDLFEEYTLQESIEFQGKFKSFISGLKATDIIALTELEKTKDKQIKYFSSGMKQRVKLAFAILADVPLLLLDEPTSNLDKKTIDWYQKMVNEYAKNKLIVVCSNQMEYEYPFCNKQLMIEDYK